jgi:uncharacterized protein YcfJ
MSIANPFTRIHPLVAIAAVAVTLVSLLGIAAITGVLPVSHSNTADTSAANPIVVPGVVEKEAWDANKPLPKSQPAKHMTHTQTASNAVAKDSAAARNPVDAPVQSAPKAAPQNSPVGIGVGAVIGGVLGNQVGSGDGKTLATILGAVGGGYVGNEVAKKNQQP